MKVALVTTPPSARSKVGRYTRELLPYLREHVDVEVFVEAGFDEELAELPLRAAKDLDPSAFDQIVYQLGNEPGHAFMLRMIDRLGGTVALHDWVLSDLARGAFPALERGGLAGKLVALREGGLREARKYSENKAERLSLCLNRSVVRRGDAFIVHSEWLRKKILVERGGPTPTGLVPYGVEKRFSTADRRALRTKLGLPDDFCSGVVVTSLGALRDHKRIDVLLEALSRARASNPELRLVLAGQDRTEGLDLTALLAKHALGDAVHLTGWVEESDADDQLAAADFCVHLRGPSTGGASSGLHRAIGAGRLVITSDRPEHAELPRECVLRVPNEEGEATALAKELSDLARDANRRAELEANVRRYVESAGHWSQVAKRYAEILGRLPPSRSNRKSLIDSAIEAADARREQRKLEAEGKLPR